MSMEEKDIHEVFEIKKLIGSGSYGTILLCEYNDEYLRGQRNQVAVKRVRCRGMNELFNAINEVLQLQDLRHPGIVVFYDTFRSAVSSGDYEEEVFINIVMEYIDGGDLHEKFELERVDEDFLTDLLEQVSDALKLLHSRKMIHRDISPGNLMMMKHRERNIFRIVDFGFVSKVCSNHGGYVGTKCYIAPEIAMHQNYDSQVDVFSLAAVCLNLMLSNSSMEVWRIVQRSNSRVDLKKSLKKREYSEGLIELILDMLEVNPRKRIVAEEVVNRVKKLKRMSTTTLFSSPLVGFDYEMYPSIEDDEEYQFHFYWDTKITSKVENLEEWKNMREEEKELVGHYHINSLPPIILSRIFQYLSFSSISTVCSLVSKNWRYVTLCDDLWIHLFRRKWKIINQQQQKQHQHQHQQHQMNNLKWRETYFDRYILEKNKRAGKYKRQEIFTGEQDVCFDISSELLVIGGKSGNLFFFDPQDNFKKLCEVRKAHHNQSVRGIQIIPEEKIVVTCGDDSSVQTWCFKNLRKPLNEIRKLDEKRKSKSKRRDERYLSIFYHSETKKLFVGDTRFLIIFSLFTEGPNRGYLVEELKKHVSRHSDGVYSITLGPLGKILYVRSTWAIRMLLPYSPYTIIDSIRDSENQVWGFAVSSSSSTSQHDDHSHGKNQKGDKEEEVECGSSNNDSDVNDTQNIYVGTICTKNERDLVVYKRVPKSMKIVRRRGKSKNSLSPSSSLSSFNSSSDEEEKKSYKANINNNNNNNNNDNNNNNSIKKNNYQYLLANSDRYKYVVTKRFRFRDSGVISNVLLTSDKKMVILGTSMGSIFVLDRNDVTLPVLWARKVARHIQQIKLFGDDESKLLVLVSRNKSESFLVLDFSKPLRRVISQIKVPKRGRWKGTDDSYGNNNNKYNSIINPPSSPNSARRYGKGRGGISGYHGGNLGHHFGGRNKNKNYLRYKQSSRFSKPKKKKKKKKKGKKKKKN